MSGERFVVAGLAHVRSAWFARVAQWATGGVVPVEFVKCVSVAELRTRVDGSRPFSAVLLDADFSGVDRDLLDGLGSRDVRPFVVTAPDRAASWEALGALTLDPDFTAADLADALHHHARLVPRTADVPAALDPTAAPLPIAPGEMVAVTGPGGTGTSVLAAAIASGSAVDHTRVLLADLALRADQAMLHDSREMIPGVQELVEAHRTGHPAPDDIVRLTFGVDGRGYRLLLGLRRARDWTALRPRAFRAALHSLRTTFDVVVADLSPDLDGEATTGSADVEDRHLMARIGVTQAHLVAVVSGPSMKGLHSLARLAGDLADAGVAPDRILPLVNHAPRSPRSRAEITAAVAALCAAIPGGNRMPSPAFVPAVRSLEAALRDGRPLPRTLVTAATSPVRSMLRSLERRAEVGSEADGPAVEPEPVAPGSLGSWADDDGEAVA